MAGTSAPCAYDPFHLPFYRKWLPRGGEAPPPRHVSLDLTYRCNLRCNMCFLYGEHLSRRNPTVETLRQRPELPISAWKNLLAELWQMGVRNLVLTGGELFLKASVLDLIDFAVRSGFSVSILTNGALISAEVARSLVRIAPQFLRFSLDGDRDTHDAICRRPNYDRLMRAIDRIRAAQRQRADGLPRLGFEAVVQKRNQDRLRHVVEVAHVKGIEHVTISNLFFTPSRRDSRVQQRTRDVVDALREIDATVVEAELEECRRLARLWDIQLVCRMQTQDEIEAVYADPRFSYLSRCFYPWLMARINPYGDVIPCTGSGLVLGNVRMHSFSEIWNGASYRNFRKDLLGAGLFPECAKCNTLSDENWKVWNKVDPVFVPAESSR